MSRAKADRLEKELLKLQRDGERLRRSRAFWNAKITDAALEKLRDEYRQKHERWVALKAQTELDL